jgi:hypothetical protein
MVRLCFGLSLQQRKACVEEPAQTTCLGYLRRALLAAVREQEYLCSVQVSCVLIQGFCEFQSHPFRSRPFLLPRSF